jgi:hypothetical protein
MTHNRYESEPLAGVVDLFQRRLHMPDPGIVLVTLATVVANLMTGDPLWLLIVGPPSSAKTECLDALCRVKGYLAVSTFTEAGLLSGSSVRAGDTGATGGLLMQLGEAGLLVFKDFTTVLSEHGSTRARLLACLREVYDGSYTRRLGTMGGRTFTWEGKAGFLGAVTGAVDNVDFGLLGERFVYYRLPAQDENAEFLSGLAAIENVGRQGEIRRERAEAVRDLMAGLSVPEAPPTMTPEDEDRLITLALLGVRCRSAVVRDSNRRDIDLVPDHERSPRLIAQLGQLAAGLKVIGVSDAESWRLLAQLALDGMHAGRRTVLETLMGLGDIHSTASLAGHCRRPQTTTRRHLEDLNAHGVVDRLGDHPERWVVSDWTLKRWWSVTGARS